MRGGVRIRLDEHGRARAHAYDTEYGQLQLEQSTWAMPARAEKIARDTLKNLEVHLA